MGMYMRAVYEPPQAPAVTILGIWKWRVGVGLAASATADRIAIAKNRFMP
jgi:hypothetical protein